MKHKVFAIGKSLLLLLSFFLIKSFLITLIDPFNSKTFTKILITALLTASLTILFRKDIFHQIKEIKKQPFKNFLKYILIFIFANAIVFLINMVILSVTNNIATNEFAAQANIRLTPLTSFITTCILVPFYEEILLRLNFRNCFKRKWTFILFTGIFFGSLHVLNAQTIKELLYLIPYSILGVSLSYIYRDSENIFNSIIIHFLNNIISFIFVIIGGF